MACMWGSLLLPCSNAFSTLALSVSMMLCCPAIAASSAARLIAMASTEKMEVNFGNLMAHFVMDEYMPHPAALFATEPSV